MDALTQIKKLSPYLDPHLLLFLLQSNIGEDSQGLQDQIRSKLVGANAERAAELTKEAEETAEKLITLLSDGQAVGKMRKEG